MREVYVRKITSYSNVSSGFVAYCFKKEISNLNYIFYLFHICSKLISISDKKEEPTLQLKKSKRIVRVIFLLFNTIIFLYTFYIIFVLLLDITSSIQVLVNILINMFMTYVCFQSYKYLCFLELVANLDNTTYESLSNP